MILKVLSYNIHKGFDWNNKNYFLKEIKDFIKTLDVDIVFLQEVVGKNTHLEKSGLIDTQFEFLADELWPHYSYAHNAVYDHGHHGNLILS
jgi:endonuclease/exonuclease/phosphatase family metal-dependent hydrolase